MWAQQLQVPGSRDGLNISGARAAGGILAGPGIDRVFPALAGGFLSIVPPEKPPVSILIGDLNEGLKAEVKVILIEYLDNTKLAEMANALKKQNVNHLNKCSYDSKLKQNNKYKTSSLRSISLTNPHIRGEF